MKYILFFALINFVNVILQTFKSLATVKSGKIVASLMNAICYGFYVVVIVWTVRDINLWAKIIIVALMNFVGVYLSKVIFDKLQKDKLWKVEVIVPNILSEDIENDLKSTFHTVVKSEDKTIYYFYCETKEDTRRVIKECKKYSSEKNPVKFFAHESFEI